MDVMKISRLMNLNGGMRRLVIVRMSLLSTLDNREGV